jgi:predicted TIM-barrel fold metal-dependent hydrolase
MNNAHSDWAIKPIGPASEALNELGLVDHHVHGVIRNNPTLEAFTNMITESDRTPTSLVEAFDTQVGFATRRWVAPLLDLEPFASPEDYFERRISLGAEEVNQRLLQSTGIDHYFVETGYRGDELADPSEMANISGAKVSEIIRIESVAEKLALSGVFASDFGSGFKDQLIESSASAIGLKSIVAYRIGLDFEATAPSPTQVQSAAGKWLKEVETTGIARICDPILLRHLIFTAAELGKPIQFHTGFGDPDLNLHRCDPLLMTDLIRQFEVRNIPVLLLHTYPFQRNAGYLAQMFRNVYLDVGLAINYSGARSGAIIAESLELAPFHKVLFSSDAWGLSELTYLGALLFRRGLGEVIDNFVAKGDWSATDAVNVVTAIGRDNALNAYGLGDQ